MGDLGHVATQVKYEDGKWDIYGKTYCMWRVPFCSEVLALDDQLQFVLGRMMEQQRLSMFGDGGDNDPIASLSLYAEPFRRENAKQENKGCPMLTRDNWLRLKKTREEELQQALKRRFAAFRRRLGRQTRLSRR